ncbi:Transcription factor GATA-4, partial [Araneus ventricosus]
MNSSFNVSPTSSEINRSSNLTDVPSILSERLNAPNVVQSAYQ